ITIFFAAFASLREIFRMFGCGFAALGISAVNISFTVNAEEPFLRFHFASGTFFRRVSRKPAGNGSLFSSIARFALTHASEYLSCSYRENAHSRQLRAYLGSI